MTGRMKYTEDQVKATLAIYDAAVKAKSPRPYVVASRKSKIPRGTIVSWVQCRAGGQQQARSIGKDEVFQELLDLLKKHGAGLSQAEYHRSAKQPGLYKRWWNTWNTFKLAGLKGAGVDKDSLRRTQGGGLRLATDLEGRERQRYDDRIAGLQKQLKEAHREINAGEDLRRSVFRLADQPVDPPQWTVDDSRSKSKPGIPVLFTSDFQWGEVIKPNELDGVNAYNQEIARTRYKRLIERTLDLCKHHMVNPDYPGIVYLRGGDMISGDIHEELKQTNDLQAIPAVLDLTEQEITGIRTLADRFKHVHVISVPGNHGRTTIKPGAKRFVETNYDYLSSCILERELKADKRITFRSPMSGDARFAIYGWWFLLTHGDRIGSSGGQGFIGPAATITRGMKKLVDYAHALGQHVDWTLVGHFHTRMELEYGLSNGSLSGYSEYAKTFRMKPQPPEQWLFFVHPRHGITCRWPILLGQRPKIASNLPAIHVE